VRLARIFVLDNAGDADAGAISNLSGAEAAYQLLQNTYRPEYLDLARRRTAHFADCARLAASTAVARLSRRRDKSWLMKTAAFVERTARRF
jgi:hypothetical protein